MVEVILAMLISKRYFYFDHVLSQRSCGIDSYSRKFLHIIFLMLNKCLQCFHIRKHHIVRYPRCSYYVINQTSLLRYCGLNIVKHKDILNDMEQKGFIRRVEEPWGNKKIIKYNVTEEGKEFCKRILEPY